MSDKKTPLEQALDLFIYAPLGLALSARDELPKLADKGRQQVSGQLMMAKMIGEFAVKQGQTEAEKAVKQAVNRLGDLAGRSAPAANRAAGSPAPAAATSNGSAAPPTAPPTSTAKTGANGASPIADATTPPIGADHLAIPGYDVLSASQVVPRLTGLAPEELEAVRTYEAATRGRKTILSRIGQLQAGSR